MVTTKLTRRPVAILGPIGFAVAVTLGNSPARTQPAADPPAVRLVSSGMLFDPDLFASCHASTIVATREGPVVAWFAGSREGAPDVGIWLARRVDDKWTEPVCVADGQQENGSRLACWNPVLFQLEGDQLVLFYKVGLRAARWWGMMRQSPDLGQTWGPASSLPEGFCGPVRSKPMIVGDTFVCGASTEHDGWRVHFELANLALDHWRRVEPARSSDEDPQADAGGAVALDRDAIQPTILRHGPQRLQALCRTRRGVIAETWSADNGLTWSALAPTELPNPNSAIDATTLRDGRHLLVYNHATPTSEGGRGRAVLNVANWRPAIVLEDAKGEFSYPAVIQDDDGLVHITYTYQRRSIKHVVLDVERQAR